MTSGRAARCRLALAAALGSALAVIAGPAAGASAAAAAPGGMRRPAALAAPAAVEQFSRTLTPRSPDFRATDANSTFTAQVTFSRSLPMLWGFRLSRALQAVAVGDMTCNASIAGRRNYHDHHVIPPKSFWHSTIPANNNKQKFTLEGSCRFRVNLGGETGTATVTFEFHYIIKR